MMRYLLILALLCVSLGEARSQAALAPIASTSAENNHILRTTPGRFWGVYVTNLTATAGFVVVLNATASPADGAITPLLCQALPASGNTQLEMKIRPAAFNIGIVVVLTSAATCLTKTTGVITGFISGLVD